MLQKFECVDSFFQLFFSSISLFDSIHHKKVKKKEKNFKQNQFQLYLFCFFIFLCVVFDYGIGKSFFIASQHTPSLISVRKKHKHNRKQTNINHKTKNRNALPQILEILLTQTAESEKLMDELEESDGEEEQANILAARNALDDEEYGMFVFFNCSCFFLTNLCLFVSNSSKIFPKRNFNSR